MLSFRQLLVLVLGLVVCAAGAARERSPLPTGAQAVLLGEVHDHAEGHALRLQLLAAAVADGWRPALALEQFDREQQAALSAAQKHCGHDIDCLIARAGGDTAWDWVLYRPLLALAQTYELPLLAANLSRADAVRLVREGLAGLPAADDFLRVALAAVPADLQQGQEAAVAAGHCGLLPASLLPRMAMAQIARDVVMAEVLRSQLQSPLRAEQERGVVLIAGNGHVRRDLGVPRWLPASISIGFIEDGADSRRQLRRRHDRVERLSALTRPDPCQALSGTPAGALLK